MGPAGGPRQFVLPPVSLAVLARPPTGPTARISVLDDLLLSYLIVRNKPGPKPIPAATCVRGESAPGPSRPLTWTTRPVSPHSPPQRPSQTHSSHPSKNLGWAHMTGEVTGWASDATLKARSLTIHPSRHSLPSLGDYTTTFLPVGPHTMVVVASHLPAAAAFTSPVVRGRLATTWPWRSWCTMGRPPSAVMRPLLAAPTRRICMVVFRAAPHCCCGSKRGEQG